MSKLSTRKTLSIIIMLAIVLSTIPLLTPINAQTSNTVELEGVVQDESNFKVSHAKVYLVNTCTGARDELTTGADGWFSFPVEEGNYAIYSAASGYISMNDMDNNKMTKKYVSVSLDSKPTPVVLTLRKVPAKESEKVMVNGTVMNSVTLIGIDGAMVKFRSIDGNYTGYMKSTETETMEIFVNGSSTNVTGKFEIELFNGMFHMMVMHNSYLTYEATVNISGDTGLGNITIDKRIDERSDLVSGFISDAQTGSYISGTAYLYDWNNGLFLTSETEGKFFEISAYAPGKFMLVVDADGYEPTYYNEIILTDLDNYWSQDVQLEPIALDEDENPIRDETMTTTVDFGTDWNTTAVHIDWVMDADSMIYGLEQEGKGGLRYQIDFESIKWTGNRDQAVDLDEVKDFEAFLNERGPCRVSTRDFITVNGSHFTQSSYFVTTSNVAKNYMTVDYEPITLKSDTNYQIDEGESGDSFNIVIGQLNPRETVKIKIPKNFEISKWAPAEAEFELMSFYEAEISSSDVTLTVNRLDGPVAAMTVTGTYVTPLTDLIFNGSKSTDDAGRGIQNYTWKMDDGTTLYGEEIVFNYSKAGEFNVTLTVMDSSDLTDMTWQVIQVDDTAPKPSFVIENETHVEYPKDNQGRYVIDEDKTVFFNATKSTDTLDGTVPVELDVENGASFKWDFGDGKEPDSGPEVNHYYHFFAADNEDPQFNITLNVTDRAGNYKELMGYVVVADKGMCTGVIGRVDSVNIGTPIEWNASSSFDNFYKTESLTFKWDFGDNTTGTGMVVEHTYALPGTYEAILNVSDPADNWNLAYSGPVTVSGVNLAITNIFFDVSKIDEGDKLKIQVNVTNTHFGTISGADAYDMTITLYDGSKKIGEETLDTLLFDSFAVIDFTWKATDGGKTHNINANITLLNTTWELSWDDNYRERSIEVKEPQTNTAAIIAAILVIGVIAVFLLIFLRRRGILGSGFGKSKKKDKKKDKKDKKKGKKK